MGEKWIFIKNAVTTLDWRKWPHKKWKYRSESQNRGIEIRAIKGGLQF